MKTFSLILSVYFMLLSGVPCGDGDSCVDEKRSGKEVVASSHEHSDEEVDYCSPLCVCNCCHTQINQPSYFYFQAFLPGFSDKNSILKMHSFPIVSKSIWQPPKVS